MKKGKSPISASSCMPLLCYASLKLDRITIIEIASKRSLVCGFTCAVIRFDIILMLMEKVRFFFDNMF